LVGVGIAGRDGLRAVPLILGSLAQHSLTGTDPVPAFEMQRAEIMLNCFSVFPLEIAVCGFREKCLARIAKTNIVHALPRLAEEEFAARAAFLSPDDWD